MFTQWTRPFHASERRNSYLMSKGHKVHCSFRVENESWICFKTFLKKSLLFPPSSFDLLPKKIPRPKFNFSFATYFSFTFAFGTTVALTMPPPSIIKSQPMMKIVVLFLCPVIPAGKSCLIRHLFVESTSSVFVLLESMFGVKGDLKGICFIFPFLEVPNGCSRIKSAFTEKKKTRSQPPLGASFEPSVSAPPITQSSKSIKGVVAIQSMYRISGTFLPAITTSLIPVTFAKYAAAAMDVTKKVTT